MHQSFILACAVFTIYVYRLFTLSVETPWKNVCISVHALLHSVVAVSADAVHAIPTISHTEKETHTHTFQALHRPYIIIAWKYIICFAWFLFFHSFYFILSTHKDRRIYSISKSSKSSHFCPVFFFLWLRLIYEYFVGLDSFIFKSLEWNNKQTKKKWEAHAHTTRHDEKKHNFEAREHNQF